MILSSTYISAGIAIHMQRKMDGGASDSEHRNCSSWSSAENCKKFNRTLLEKSSSKKMCS